MAEVVVLGGGICGLAAGMMLARDGHDVCLLERDPAPVPASPEAAWKAWERSGVAQFRQAHMLAARGRLVLEDELPDVLDALVAAGGLRADPLFRLPPSIGDRSPRPGDERFATVTARRPVLEQVLGRAAERQPRLEVRRGVAAAGLITGDRGRVAGVRTDAGEVLEADLVVDAMGRRSPLPAMLAASGAGTLAEEAEPGGFVYYTRFFRSRDGRLPVPRAALLTNLPWLSIATLPADAGTWSVTLYVAGADRAAKAVRDPETWTAVVAGSPLHAHWLDGEPLGGIEAMGGVSGRRRRLDGPRDQPVAGLALLGDAAGCTSPSLGRGMALGLLHAARLRQLARTHLAPGSAHPATPRPPRIGGRAADRAGFAHAWAQDTERELMPYYRATVTADRTRRAELRAALAGAPPPPPRDPLAAVARALPAAMAHDADAFRAGMEIIGCLALPEDVLARPGLAERVLRAAREAPPPPPGPPRELLLARAAA